MPDFNNIPRTTTSVQLFDNSLKNTELTQLFGLDGARMIIVLQKATHLATEARVITSETIASGGAENAIDDNQSTKCGQQTSGNGGVGQFEIVIDFGSIAVRTINTKGESSAQADSSGGGSASCSISYSTDNVSYSGGGVIASVSGQASMTVTSTVTRQDVGVNMRYAKFTTTSGTGGGSSWQYSYCYECWNPVSGLGSSTFKIQIKDPYSGDWVDYIPTSDFTGQNSDTGSTDLQQFGENATKKYILPSNSDLLRGVITPTGGVNTMVTVLRVYG